MLHVNIIMLHFDIDMSHIIIIMLYADIRLIYLACRGEKYATNVLQFSCFNHSQNFYTLLNKIYAQVYHLSFHSKLLIMLQYLVLCTVESLNLTENRWVHEFKIMQ